MRIAAISVGLILCSAVLSADERNVTSDPGTDFSALKTFMVREAKVNSFRPELTNQLFIKQLASTIRAELTKKKMTDTPDRPHVAIDCFITGIDYRIGPDLFTQATLVVDMREVASGVLVWQGTYRDPKSTAPKLAKNLPDGLKKLFSEYPPKKKK